MSVSFEHIINRSLEDVHHVLIDNRYPIEGDERADKLQLISLYRQDHQLSPTDTIYATSTLFERLFKMDKSELLTFAEEQYVELPPVSDIDMIRIIISTVDPYAIMKLNNGQVKCSESFKGAPIDPLTLNRINKSRMVMIPTLGSLEANCYDIVSISHFWEDLTVYTDPANGRVLPPVMVDILLDNEKAWKSAVMTDLKETRRLSNVNPYDAHPYRNLYQRIYREIIDRIVNMIRSGESLDHLLFKYIGNAQIVKLLLDNGVNPNITDNRGEPVLHIAVLLDYVNIVKLLLNYGADPNRTDGHGDTALISTARSPTGLPNVVSLLLNNGANPNFINESGDTALILAARRVNIQTFMILIEAGASMDYADHLGNTVLFYLTYYETDPEVAHLYDRLIGEENWLIKLGVNLHHVNNDRQTALFTVSPQITQFLVKNGVDINHIDIHGQTALFNLDDPNKADILIENGINIHHTDHDEKNALFSSEHPEISSRLIERGIDINHPDNGGKTVLFYVIYIDIVNMLIDRGIDVNHADNDGNTAIYYYGDQYLAELLITNGININHANNVGRTALFYVFYHTAKSLIRHHADVNHQDHDGNTPLFNLVYRAVAEMLVKNGAHVNHVNNKGQTALFTASAEVTEYLISHGADIHHQDNEGNTALFYATDAETANLLIEHGINVNHLNTKRQTALFTITTDRGNGVPHDTVSIINILLMNGIHFDHLDSEGHTAIQTMNRQQDIMTLYHHGAYPPSELLYWIEHNQETIDDFISYVASLELVTPSPSPSSMVPPSHHIIKPMPDMLYRVLSDLYSWEFARWAIYNSKIMLNCCRDVKKYTYKYDQPINNILRFGQDQWDDDTYQVVEDVYRALEEATPLPEDMTIYRGVKSYGRRKYVNIQVGDALTMTGFSSFTLDIAVAERFAGKSIDNFVLKTVFPKGAKVLFLDANFYTSYWEEKEILTYPNIKLEVVSKTNSMDIEYRVIEAKRIGAGDQQIHQIW